MRAARSAAVRRGALGLVVVVAGALVAAAPPVAAAVAPGETRLVTRADDGPHPGADAVETTLSGDGAHIAFSSREDYTGRDNDSAVNVFARDLATGVTTQISLGHLPTEGDPVYDQSPNGDSSQPSLSADGRFVAFVTTATDITVHTGDVPNDSAPDVLVADRDADANGVLDDSQPVFSRVTENWYVYGEPRKPVLTADGSRIVWTELSPETGALSVVRYRNLADGVPVGPIRDVQPDTDTEDLLVALNAYDGTISADGSRIALVVDWIEYSDIGLRSRPLVNLGGRQSAYFPDYTAIMLVCLDSDGEPDEVLRVDFDEVAGDFIGLSRRVGVRFPALSADGAVLAFEAEGYTTTSSGAWFPTADQPNVYVSLVDDERSEIVSLDVDGAQRNGARPALSADGRYLAFVTDSLRMHDGVDRDTVAESCLHEAIGVAAVPPPSEERAERTFCQVVVRDLVLDADRAAAEEPRLPAVLASPGVDRGCVEALPPGESCAGDGDSGLSAARLILDFGEGEGVPVLSADGSRVAFDSFAEHLTEDDPFVDDGAVREWDGFVRTFQPGLAADPIDFGPADVGSTVSRTATLLVVGAGPVRVASVSVDGVDFAPGAETCTGAVLHRGGSCLAAVAFAPSAAVARTGALVVRLVDGREFRVDLRGRGSEAPVVPDGPEFTASPPSVDFGARLLLSSDPTARVRITNSGDAPMTVASAAPASPGDFTVVANGCAVVATGATCVVVVQFRPTRPGPRTGVLRVDSDAPGGPHLIGLSGSGSTPTLVVNPGVTKPGRVISVSGTGFPAAAEVTVGYRESIETGTVLTSNEGAFTVSLLVFPKASIGQRTVLAAVPGLADDVVEPGRLLVVFPSMSPPEFLTRG